MPILNQTRSAEVESNWHCLSGQDVAREVEVDPQVGLTTQQAAERQNSFGLNRLFEKPPRSPWLLFFGQFKSLLILILMMGAGLAASIGNIKDATVILSVVFLNAILGF